MERLKSPERGQDDRATKSNESGQAVTEYVLLVAMVVGIFLAATNMITSTGVMNRVMTPLTTDFAHAYQFGDPHALGYPPDDQGGPVNHPRAEVNGGSDNNNFRIFREVQ